VFIRTGWFIWGVGEMNRFDFYVWFLSAITVLLLFGGFLAEAVMLYCTTMIIYTLNAIYKEIKDD
jgi:hypothetical protein